MKYSALFDTGEVWGERQWCQIIGTGVRAGRRRGTAMSVSDAVAPVLGGAVVLFVVLLFAVALLAAHYRRECAQLRERNTQLSAENDRWREDFSAQAGELTALRRFVPRPGRVIDLSHAEVP
jgi:hypothetical protein